MKINTNAVFKASGGIAGLAILFVILIAVNVIVGNLHLGRIDLTEQKLYTLSEGSKSLLQKLDRPVTLKFFFNSSSTEMPGMLKTYARQVEDFLMEYQMASNGKILVEKYDPKPDSDAEEWAQSYGISGQQLGVMGPTIYLGLVAVSGDSQATLPVLDPRSENLLEYHITRLIYRALRPEKPVLGVISSLPVLGGGSADMPPNPMSDKKGWMSLNELKGDYELRNLALPLEKIDSDINALLIIHPKELTDQSLYAIDQFVLRGGHVVAFVDPLCVTDMENSAGASPFQRPNVSSDMKKLFDAWGVGYESDKVLADPRAVSQLRTPQNRVEESPVWLSLRNTNVNSDDILTAKLESLMLPYCGAFVDKTNDKLDMTPLIKSSDSAGLVSVMTAQFGLSAIRQEFKPQGTPLSIAVRVAGTFTTAFPDGKPKAEAKDDEDSDKAKPEESVAESIKEGKSTVILVADADMIYDRFCVRELNFFGYNAMQPLNDNLTLLANSAEQMAGSSDLVSIRSRGNFDRPFEVVMALEQKARVEWNEKERSLEQKLQETQQQLNSLQSQKDQSQKFILSQEQQAAVDNFRKEVVQIKRELKDVRKNLRSDIDQLGVKVKVVNIALIPVLVAIAGIAFGVYRKRRT